MSPGEYSPLIQTNPREHIPLIQMNPRDRLPIQTNPGSTAPLRRSATSRLSLQTSLLEYAEAPSPVKFFVKTWSKEGRQRGGWVSMEWGVDLTSAGGNLDMIRLLLNRDVTSLPWWFLSRSESFQSM